MAILTLRGIRLNVAALTDVGLKRAANEDSYLAEGPSFLVADGMGGYESGDRASAAVVSAFRERFSASDWGDFTGVNAALIDADDRVAVVAAGTTRGAGSTASGVVMVDHGGIAYWLVFNVGDSRVYRHHGSELEQLTIDHSLGQELVDRGELAASDLATFPSKNIITRAIGAADSLADSWLVPVVNGERLLICSDGLHGEVDDESIRAALTMNGQPEAAAQVLVDRAKANGGRDNITVVIVDVVAGGSDIPSDFTTGVRLAPEVEDTLPV
ncbi:PP2C family serine/threonine-protein phosphatase [Salinibacterium sp. ZJ70]|uniref:PP2C family protein-serine/threonine phosphatase n=1 Tax=Salinibacterium sp. ZJ70 TaxID=2708084 RepID=UPI001CD202C4|nr:protein phosphatase 2C domain-containing protein [Salinibacterium sp. ZJ70]